MSVVSRQKKNIKKSVDVPVGIFVKIYLLIKKFFLYLFVLSTVILILDVFIERNIVHAPIRLIPNISLVDTIGGLIYGVFSLVIALLDFLDELILRPEHRFYIDPIFEVLVKFAVWGTDIVVEVVLDVFSLPFRLLTLINGNNPVFVGYKLNLFCDVADICGPSVVPDYDKLSQLDDVISLWIGIDLHGAFDIGFFIKTSGIGIPTGALKDIPFVNLVFTGDSYFGKENIHFMATISLGEVIRSSQDGERTIRAFGWHLEVFIISIFDGATYGSLEELLADWLRGMDDFLGSWREIFDRVYRKSWIGDIVDEYFPDV